MAKGEIVKNVVGYLVGEIVDNPDQVTVDIVEESDEEIVAEVRCAKPDMGRVIGKSGRTAKALRTLISSAAAKANVYVTLEIVE